MNIELILRVDGKDKTIKSFIEPTLYDDLKSVFGIDPEREMQIIFLHEALEELKRNYCYERM